ncbi:DUF499 domain-containing protein, partial [Desulfosarcina sp.]|nr:DUF499 domain-containing protein [Desulfosarcina sp.]
MQTIFDLCQPRKDVLEGRIRDEEFAADLSKVINGAAVPEYGDPALFFRYTHPTRGLKTLLETICRRLSGVGGELNSVIRLDTQYGGGKTHSLIALTHAVRGMSGVESIEEFVDPSLLPKGNVRVAALDGERSDPSNGLKLEEGLFAHSLWGEMAYQLAGRDGFERVKKSDQNHNAPGESTITELFGGEPTLILIDEISVYLRKATLAFGEAANQFTAFIQALIKAVSSTPNVALVCTLAVRLEDQKATDAYKAEQQIAVTAFSEVESVVSRTLLQLDPTEEDETVDVLRRRLFEDVNDVEKDDVLNAYFKLWDKNRDILSPDAISPEVRDQFKKGYPFHPEILNVMVEKISSLSNFQRTRGMLRLLTRTVHHLWKEKPDDAYAIHPHHIDPGHASIRGEITTKLNQGVYAPALSADVAAVPGKDPATAQRIDSDQFPGQAPVTSYVARTIFLNTMAFGDSAQGISSEQLRYSVCSMAIEPALVEASRKSFAIDSMYLDDRPGASMRFRVEPNLALIINRSMRDVDPGDLRDVLQTKIKDLFSGKPGDFELIPFPAGPYEVPDDVGNGQPYLVVLHYDALTVSEMHSELPSDLARLATKKGASEDVRILQNNMVFVVADKKLRTDMKDAVRRRLGLAAIQSGPQMEDLAAYQQKRIEEMLETSISSMAITTLQCYRHLFYPSSAPIGTGAAKIGHTTIELVNASDSPGNGQQHIKRSLREQKKLLMADDQPDAPTYVRDQTPLKNKGEITVAELRNEFRKAPKLSILMDDSPLVSCIRLGIEHGHFIYREGDLVWGKGDPNPTIQLTNNTFVHTLEDAKNKKIWPRPPKEEKIEVPETKAETPGATSGTEVVPESGDGESSNRDPGETKGIRERESSFAEATVISAEGPLRQALVELFEKARKQDIDGFEIVTIRFFEHKGAWAIHQTLATYRGADSTCSLEVEMEMDGVDSFSVNFSGTLEKANSI